MRRLLLILGLILAPVFLGAADATPDVPLGSTRDQVLRTMVGEPSRLTDGTREILIYPSARITLENGIVTEFMRLDGRSGARSTNTGRSASTTPTSRTVTTPTPASRSTATAAQPSGTTSTSSGRSSATVAPVANPRGSANTAPQGSTSQTRPATAPRPSVSLLSLFLKPLLLLAGGTIGALLIKAYTLNKLGKSNHSDLVRDVLGSRSRSDRPPTRSTENILTTDLLHKLEWKRFEDLVQGYYEAKGHRAEQTGPGADGGVDIFLYDPSNHRPTTYVQCKSWFGTDVGVEKVRELFGVMARDAVPHGIFLTTSGYTPDARAFAKGQPLELIDGVTFIERFNLLPANSRQRILNGVTEGDYWTPSCPKCEVKMVFRDNAKNPFWGCRRFPKCHSKIYPRSSVKAMP